MLNETNNYTIPLELLIPLELTTLFRTYNTIYDSLLVSNNYLIEYIIQTALLRSALCIMGNGGFRSSDKIIYMKGGCYEGKIR